MSITFLRVRSEQRGLLLRNGEFERILAPGSHWIVARRDFIHVQPLAPPQAAELRAYVATLAAEPISHAWAPPVPRALPSPWDAQPPLGVAQRSALATAVMLGLGLPLALGLALPVMLLIASGAGLAGLLMHGLWELWRVRP